MKLYYNQDLIAHVRTVSKPEEHAFLDDLQQKIYNGTSLSPDEIKKIDAMLVEYKIDPMKFPSATPGVNPLEFQPQNQRYSLIELFLRAKHDPNRDEKIAKLQNRATSKNVFSQSDEDYVRDSPEFKDIMKLTASGIPKLDKHTLPSGGGVIPAASEIFPLVRFPK